MPKTPKISAEEIRDVIDYDHITGSFTWKKNISKSNLIGKEASPALASNGYRYISIGGGEILAQRVAFAIMHGKFPEKRITFKDGNKTNLKWDNLIEWEWATKSKFDHSTSEGRAEYGRAWRRENAEKYKDKTLKSDFGISIDQYNEMLLSQKGCCAICNHPETASRSGKIKALAVDHCHETGNIRSLLCSTCNVGLGAYKDKPELLRQAAEYIEHHKTKKTNVIQLNKGAN